MPAGWRSRIAAAVILVAAPTFARGAASPDPAACARTIAALDSDGRVIFQTIAVAVNRPGLAAAPLEPLERVGVRWERLEVRQGSMAGGPAVDGIAIRADVNLALLRVPGLEACSAVSLPGGGPALPQPGAPVRAIRERRGYRSGTIGGRIERAIPLPETRALALVHLLDEGGADPGIVVDAEGRILGAAAPSPSAAAGSLAAVAVLTGLQLPDTTDTGGWDLPRHAIPPRPTPSFWDTIPGLAGQALLLAGPSRIERGIELLGQALALGGDAASLRIERGVLEFGAGKLAAAISDFNRASILDTSSHLARFNLGMALGAAGRYAEAAEVFRQARDLLPDHARTRYELALALKAARRGAEALQEYQALRTLDSGLADDLRLTLGL